MTMYYSPAVHLELESFAEKQVSRDVFREPHHGSPEAHLRATLARMKPERRMETLRRLLDEEIAAAQARAHEGVV